MKKIILLSITAFLIVLSGCQSGSSENPKEVFTQFMNALSKKDIASAKKLATKDSEGMMDMMQMGMQNLNNDHASKMLGFTKNMEIGDAVINGDQATIAVKDKSTGESSDFLLKKESGDWKVAFDMSTLMEMANKKMQEHGMGNMNMDSMKEGVNKAMDSLRSTMPDMKDKMEHAQKMLDSAKNMMDKMNKSVK
ncbi:MAG: hypothetical protein ABI237_05750 [Ginsengibacter sp.]